jgi:4-amino-4-deoxy-L-arabinose transferase-like glycosyltransferase
VNRLRYLRWPFAAFVLALLPRLSFLGARPLWLDEVFTLQRASLAPAALVADSFLNHHMPSFFLLLSPLVGLGNPQYWLRLPSAVFGAVAVMLVFMIAYRVAGRTAGIIAALIIGLSPVALAFSQEARSYMLEMCLILVALYGLTRLALDIPGASQPLRNPVARGGWAAFILGSVAALDVLGDGLPWLLIGNLIGATLLVQSPNRGQLLRNFIIADLIVAVCCAPFYAAMTMYQGQGYINSVMWIPPLTSERLWYNLGSVYFMRVADSVTFRFMDVPTPFALIYLIDAALAVAVGTAAWVLRRRPAMLAVLGISFVFLPLMFTVISIWRPILLPRYILWSAAPFAILAGIGASALLDHTSPRVRAIVVGGVALLLFANLVPYYNAETKPRWDIAAKLLAQDVAPGDVVYLYDSGALPILRVYLPPGTQTVVLNDSAGDLNHAKQAMRQGKRVWAVYGHAGQSGDSKALLSFFAETQALGTPSMMQVAGNRILIALYDPANPGDGVSVGCVEGLPVPGYNLAGCS